MLDEDLDALHRILQRMEPDARVDIGCFRCCAGELSWVVEEAMAARTKAKEAGTFEPYRSAVGFV